MSDHVALAEGPDVKSFGTDSVSELIEDDINMFAETTEMKLSDLYPGTWRTRTP